MSRVLTGLVAAGWVLGATAMAVGQAGAGGTAKTPASSQTQGPAPMQLQTLGQPAAPVDPFPATNPKFFTASTPTVETVNSFLKALWGYDANRLYRVAAIQTTAAQGVSKVVVFVAEKGANAKVQTTQFFVLPDQKHAIADGVVSFGAKPFADLRAMMQERADGAARGAASKDLLLVEFSDLQCPHCKEAQGTMDQLVKDFPNARVVYQSYPLAEIHPSAFTAAEYGVCVARQKNEAFFPFAQAVFDTQAMLTPEDTTKTLQAAVTKAGLDPAAIAACAATPATKEAVNASVKLAQDAGVEQTPMLVANGHPLPLTGITYEALKAVIAYQAQLDGVSTGATAPVVSGLKTRPAPSLGK